MPPAWPEDDYLKLLGQVVYSVASIEGLLIFDLPRMPNPVPGATPLDLAGKTTAMVGTALVGFVPQIVDEQWATYLAAGGNALVDIAPLRNAVLHARPATVDGMQQLHRWRIGAKTEVFTVTREHLCDVLDAIEQHRKRIKLLRPPF